MNFLQRLFNYPPNTLDEDIALAFAKHYPIEPHRILAAKDILRSWESIEALCEFTLAYGYSDPYHCIGLFLDTPEGKTFRVAYNKSFEFLHLGGAVDGGCIIGGSKAANIDERKPESAD